MNKKGSLQDIIQIGVIMLVMGVTLLIGLNVWNSFTTEFANQTTNAQALQSNAEMTGIYTGTMDNSMLFLMVGLSIVSLILASAVRIHPVFFVFFVFVLVILIFIGGVLSNVYLEMANQPEFTDEAEQLVFTTNLIGKLPWFIGILGFLIAVIMYKNYTEQ